MNKVLIPFFYCRQWQIQNIVVRKMITIYFLSDFESERHEVNHIFFTLKEDERLGKKLAQELVDEFKVYHHIVFLLYNLSSQAQYVLKLNQTRLTVKLEILYWRDIFCNKLEHVNVPHYELLTTEDQIVNLEQKRKIKRQNLSHMLTSDAIATYLGLVEGNVVYAVDADTYHYVSSSQMKTSDKKNGFKDRHSTSN
jgi:DNA-directed RNA polymerase subunit H (RpoH/RPB5)